MCTYPDIATIKLRPYSHVERFEAKRGKLLHVVVQRKQLCSDDRGRRVKSETKSKERNKKGLFVMPLLTSRGKQRKQGLAQNMASNTGFHLGGGGGGIGPP